MVLKDMCLTAKSLKSNKAKGFYYTYKNCFVGVTAC